MPSIASKFSTLGKYIDQPAIINRLKKNVPIASASMALGYTAYDIFKAPKEDKKKTAIKDLFILSFALGAAFLTTKGLTIKGKKIIKGIAHECTHHHCHHKHHHHGAIEEVLELVSKKGLTKLKTFIEKIKNKKYLKLKEVFKLNEELEKLAPDKRLISKVIPDGHIHTPKEMLEELWYLTKIGALPVVGGIAGGVIADKINGEDINKTSKNKIKEGLYQYLANITLCNAGAGIALWGLNSLGVKSKAARFAGMFAGVITVGIMFGGTIANFIGQKFINPLLDKETKHHHRHHHSHNPFAGINSERTPELIDLGLHIDDVASVGFLSGIKWIGPILPALYSISGYRAGIGYRNGEAAQIHHHHYPSIHNHYCHSQAMETIYKNFKNN